MKRVTDKIGTNLLLYELTNNENGINYNLFSYCASYRFY